MFVKLFARCVGAFFFVKTFYVIVSHVLHRNIINSDNYLSLSSPHIIDKDMSFVDTLKTAISKTSLANIGSFFLILGMLYYGITTDDRDIILTVGSAGIGYLFGVSGSKS